MKRRAEPQLAAPPRRWTAWAAPAAVVVLAVAAFAPGVDNAFVNWDDVVNLELNESIRRFDGAHLRWGWTTTLLGVWQPLSWMLAGALGASFGVTPQTFHVASLTLHAASTLLVYALAVRLVRLAMPDAAARAGARVHVAAAFAAALFAVHPLRVEVVTWATCQPYALCAMFYLLTIHAYLSAARGGKSITARRAWYAASIAFCAAAVLSKGVAVSVIVVLFVLDIYPLRRFRFAPGVFVEKLPHIAVVGLAVWMGMRATQSNATLAHLGLLDRVAISAYGLVFPLLKTLLPLGLSPYYPVPADFRPTELTYLICGALVIALTVALVVLRRRAPGALAAWVCYGATLAPVLGIVQHGSQLTADRYTYLATIPVSVLAAGAIVLARGRWFAGAVSATALGAIALTALTWRQVAAWENSGTLWRHALAVDSRSTFAHVNLGLFLHGQLGDTQTAIEHYQAALAIDEENANAHNDLGGALKDQGRFDEAMVHFRRAIEIDPTLPTAHTNLSVTLTLLGQFDAAEAAARDAIERERTAAAAVGVRPGPEPFEALGLALFRQRRFDEAVTQFRQLNEVHPEYAAGYHNLGSALASMNRMDEAIAAWQRAVALDPAYVDARLFLGIAHARAGRVDDARAQFEAVLRIDPAHPQAMQYLSALGGAP